MIVSFKLKDPHPFLTAALMEEKKHNKANRMNLKNTKRYLFLTFISF
jgi:hypothetical protein